MVEYIALPLSVGDTVWWVPPERYTWLERRPYRCMVVSMTITENKKRVRRQKYRIAALRGGSTTDNVHDVGFEEIGKTVFVDREDADHAVALLYSKEDNNG